MDVEKANKSKPIETMYFPKSPKKLLLNAAVVSGALWISEFPRNVTL